MDVFVFNRICLFVHVEYCWERAKSRSSSCANTQDYQFGRLQCRSIGESVSDDGHCIWNGQGDYVVATRQLRVYVESDGRYVPEGGKGD